MYDKLDNGLMTVGFNLGVFVIAELMSEGITISPKGWEIIKKYVAEDAEKLSGMPAEDFATLASKQIEPIRRMADANQE